jgi:hypothetical protein
MCASRMVISSALAMTAVFMVSGGKRGKHKVWCGFHLIWV